MKKITRLLLALLYTALVMKPFAPYVEYTVLKDYISEVLCINQDRPELNCQGKCYLNKQVNKANDVDPQSNQTPKPQKDIKLLSILVSCITGIEPAKNKLILFSQNLHFITDFYSDIPTPPPKKLC